MHVLQVVEGPDAGARYPLPRNEPQLIGRSSEALPISDHTVSRRHAELTPDDGRWFLRDLDSANGTAVNDRVIRDRVELHPGDRIRCGSTLMVFLAAPDEPEPSPIRILGPDEIDSTVEQTLAPDASHAPDVPAADALEAARKHLRLVYDLTALTASAMGRTELLERVMDLVFKEFTPDRGFILLQESAKSPSTPAVVRYRTRPRTRDEGHIPVSRTIVHHVLERGEGILAANAMQDTRFRSGDSVREYGIRTAICVPMRAGDRTLGVIHIDSSLADFSWNDADLRLMNAVGQHTGLALNAAELLEAKLHSERLAAMGEAVASLSHSIRNILQGLRGGADAVELALKRGDLAQCREGWPILSRNLDRIYQLTLNMLAWSKRRPVEIDLARLDQLLHEIAALVRPQCERRRIELNLEIDDAMPPVPIDANALHQAIMNLLVNAIDAVPDRTGRVTVRARYDDTSRAAEIAIADNGPGVPPELRESVFEPFISTKGQRGTGLGLAVARKIAEEHGGQLVLAPPPRGDRSGEHSGATFTLRIPCDAGPVDSGRTHLPRPIPPEVVDKEFE